MRGSSTPSGRECPEEFLIFRLPCDLLWTPHRSMTKARRDVKQAQCSRSQMVQLRDELFQFDPGVSIVTWGLDELLSELRRTPFIVMQSGAQLRDRNAGAVSVVPAQSTVTGEGV